MAARKEGAMRLRGRITKEQWQTERIYEFITGRMKLLKVSETKLGEVIGISQQGVNWNIKHRSFSFDQTLLILNFFDVDITDCLKYVPERSKG